MEFKNFEDLEFVPQSLAIFDIDNCCELTRTKGNRYIDPKTLLKLKKLMEAGLLVPPILVNKLTLAIIDGQHRGEAALQLWKEGIHYKLPVVFIEVSIEEEARLAKNMNGYQKHWKNYEYIKYNKDHNIPGYEELYDFVVDWTSDYWDAGMTLFNTNIDKVKAEQPVENLTKRAIKTWKIVKAIQNEFGYVDDGIHKPKCNFPDVTRSESIKVLLTKLISIDDPIGFAIACKEIGYPEFVTRKASWEVYYSKAIKLMVSK